MLTNKYLNFRNLHLLISLIIVVPTAFVYGLFPAFALPKLFDFNVDTIDLTNVFRAIMCLYLGISIIWFLGIIKPKFWQTATVINIVFMASLALGRTISLLVDGLPSTAFVIGLFAEFILALFGIIQFRKNAT